MPQPGKQRLALPQQQDHRQNQRRKHDQRDDRIRAHGHISQCHSHQNGGDHCQHIDQSIASEGKTDAEGEKADHAVGQRRDQKQQKNDEADSPGVSQSLGIQRGVLHEEAPKPVAAELKQQIHTAAAQKESQNAAGCADGQTEGNAR